MTPDADTALRALCADHPRPLFGLHAVSDVLSLPVPAAALREVASELRPLLYADEAGSITGTETALYVLRGRTFEPVGVTEARQYAAALPGRVTLHPDGPRLILRRGATERTVEVDTLSDDTQDLLLSPIRFQDITRAHVQQLRARTLLDAPEAL